MIAQILKKSFDRYFEAPLKAWEQFVELCEPVNFEKDEVLKETGTAERYFYFILKGSAGIFLWRENNFVCLDFAFDHSFCCDYMSLITGETTPLQLVALEKSEMLRITKADYARLGETPIGMTLFRISAETSFVEKQQQQIDLLTQTAEERYAQLIKRFPGVENRIAQKHIASYIGITPQSLSRIRGKVK